MQGERLRERSEVAGAELVPGTLNVHVDDLEGAVASLGEPWALSDQDNDRLGPLRWWPVWAAWYPSPTVEEGRRAWIVRHEKTGTRYLEVVSDTDFRAAGVRDGDNVRIEPR